MYSKNEKTSFNIFKTNPNFKGITGSIIKEGYKSGSLFPMDKIKNSNFKGITGSIIKEGFKSGSWFPTDKIKSSNYKGIAGSIKEGFKSGSWFPTSLMKKNDYSLNKGSMTFGNVNKTKENLHLEKEISSGKNKIVVELLDNTHQGIWFVGNLLTKAGIISTIIQVGQSPIRSLQLNKMKIGSYIPSLEGGLKAIIKSLYKGFLPGLGGSAKRGSYILGSKDLKAKEGKVEESISKNELEESTENSVLRNEMEGNLENSVSKNGKKLDFREFNWIFWSAVGEVAVSNKGETISQLKKLDKLSPDFDYKKNSTALRLEGAKFKLGMSMTSFACLLVAEEKIANSLSIENPYLKHTVAGGLSGLLSSVITFPLANFNDHRTLKTEVSKEGKIVTGSSLVLMKEIVEQLKKDPKVAVQMFINNSKGQLLLRVVTTIYIFATVSGVGAVLGEEPLKDVVPKKIQPSPKKNPSGFFNGSSDKKIEDTTNSASNEETPRDKP